MWTIWSNQCIYQRSPIQYALWVLLWICVEPLIWYFRRFWVGATVSSKQLSFLWALFYPPKGWFRPIQTIITYFIVELSSKPNLQSVLVPSHARRQQNSSNTNSSSSSAANSTINSPSTVVESQLNSNAAVTTPASWEMCTFFI